MRDTPGFLGTDAHLLADLTLLAYLLVLLPLMLIGYLYARRKMYEPDHKFIMTGVTAFNWLLIGGVMIASYTGGVASDVPQNLAEPFIWLPTLHLLIGGMAQLLATYLVLRMWLETVLPGWLLAKNIKLLMRLTLAGWITAALLGFGTYAVWYGGTTTADTGTGPQPVTTEEATSEATAAPGITPATTEEATLEATAAPGITPATTEEVQPLPTPAQTEAVVPPPVVTEEIVPAVTEDNTDQRAANEARIEALEVRLEQLEDRAADLENETLEDRADAILDRLKNLDARATDFDTRFAELEALTNQLESDF